MGNYISCTLTTTIKHPKGIKVIFPGGEIRQLARPVNAAELMLETPSHFLVNSSSLHIGRRFSALSADEDLEMGNLYVTFPMRRLNSVVAPADMGRLLMAANSAVKCASGGKARILPEFGMLPQAPLPWEPENYGRRSEVPKLNLCDIEDEEVREFQARLSMSRSKRPMLETITE